MFCANAQADPTSTYYDKLPQHAGAFDVEHAAQPQPLMFLLLAQRYHSYKEQQRAMERTPLQDEALR